MRRRKKFRAVQWEAAIIAKAPVWQIHERILVLCAICKEAGLHGGDEDFGLLHDFFCVAELHRAAFIIGYVSNPMPSIGPSRPNTFLGYVFEQGWIRVVFRVFPFIQPNWQG